MSKRDLISFVAGSKSISFARGAKLNVVLHSVEIDGAWISLLMLSKFSRLMLRLSSDKSLDFLACEKAWSLLFVGLIENPYLKILGGLGGNCMKF